MPAKIGVRCVKKIWVLVFVVVVVLLIALTFQWPEPVTIDFEIRGEGLSFARENSFEYACATKIEIPFLSTSLTTNYFVPTGFSRRPLANRPPLQVGFEGRRLVHVTMRDPMFSWGKYQCAVLGSLEIAGDPACARVWLVGVFRYDSGPNAPSADVIEKYAAAPRYRHPFEKRCREIRETRADVGLPRKSGHYRVVLDMTDLPAPVPKTQPPSGPMYGPGLSPPCQSTPDGLHCSTE